MKKLKNCGLIWGRILLKGHPICGVSAKVVNLLNFVVEVALGLLMSSSIAEGTILTATIGLFFRLNGEFESELFPRYGPRDFPLITANLN